MPASAPNVPLRVAPAIPSTPADSCSLPFLRPPSYPCPRFRSRALTIVPHGCLVPLPHTTGTCLWRVRRAREKAFLGTGFDCSRLRSIAAAKRRQITAGGKHSAAPGRNRIFQARNGRQNGCHRSAARSGLGDISSNSGGFASLHPRLYSFRRFAAGNATVSSPPPKFPAAKARECCQWCQCCQFQWPISNGGRGEAVYRMGAGFA